MGQREVSPVVVAVVVVIVAAVAVFFLYKGATGGVVTNGTPGKVEASPPMPDAAKQEMLRQHGMLRR